MCWKPFLSPVAKPTAGGTRKAEAGPRNLRQCLVAIMTASVLTDPASAVIIRHDVPVQAYADLAALPALAPVGKYVTLGQPLIASGVLVAPDWVLTAAHVAELYGVGLPQTFEVGGDVYSVTHYVTYPGWTFTLPDDFVGGLDYALAHLATPVVGVAPAVRYTGTDELTQIATIVGNGLFGDGINGLTGDHMRLAYQNVIDAHLGQFGYSDRVLLADFDHPDDPSYSSVGSPIPLPLEGGASPGDSGGGWFIDVGGQLQLAAIQSYAFKPDGSPATYTYGDITSGMRVSPVNSWIDSIVPEPGSLALMAAVLPLLRRRRCQ